MPTKKTADISPPEKRRKPTLREYSDAYSKVGVGVPKSKDYYNIVLPWATLNPGVIHTLTQLVNIEAIAIDCRKKILSHLTTHSIGVHDKHGTPVLMDPQYNIRFQRHYKKFVQEAYQSYLIHGLVPMVMIEDSSGFFFPVVAKLGTYVIQTAFSAEDESQVYRVLRPIYFCARPDKLKHYDRVDDFAFPNSFDSIYGGTTHSSCGIQLGPHPAAGQDITVSIVKEKGWFIDRSISVLDVFDSAPSPLGDIRSPLMGLLFSHNVTQCLADIMLRSEYKMLSPAYLLEPRPATNVDKRDMEQTPFGPQGNPAADEAVSMNLLTMNMRNVLAPIPSLDKLAPQQILHIESQQRELRKASNSPMFNNPTALGGNVMRNYYRRLAEDAAKGEVEGKVRYCPEGFVFSGANKHPEAHAGSRYFESKEDFSRMICSTFGVPISLIYTTSKESSGIAEGQMQLFQRTVSNLCIQFNNILTQIFRESLTADTKQFSRMMSVKSVSEDFAYIDAENNRNPDRYRRNTTKVDFMGASEAGKSSLPEMIPRYAALPTPSEEEIHHIIQAQPFNNTPAKPMNPEDPTSKPSQDRPKTAEENFVKDPAHDKKSMAERFSGPPIEPMADVTNMRQTIEAAKLTKDVHNEYGKSMRVEGPMHEISKKRKREGDVEFDITDLTVCMDPVVFYDREALLEVAKAGCISIPHYQRALCEGNNITQPTSYGGIDGARENANFFNIIEFGEITVVNESAKEDKGHKREKEMFKMTAEKEKSQLAQKEAVKPKPGKK